MLGKHGSQTDKQNISIYCIILYYSRYKDDIIRKCEILTCASKYLLLESISELIMK